MTAQTPGCGSNTDARKRQREAEAARAETPETTGLAARLAAVEAERDRLAAAVERVRAVLGEWGAIATDGDFVSDEDFAEAIRDSGAWRLARDLRAALSDAGRGK